MECEQLGLILEGNIYINSTLEIGKQSFTCQHLLLANTMFIIVLIKTWNFGTLCCLVLVCSILLLATINSYHSRM